MRFLMWPVKNAKNLSKGVGHSPPENVVYTSIMGLQSTTVGDIPFSNKNLKLALIKMLKLLLLQL